MNKHIDQPQNIASCQIDILELPKSSQLCHIEKLKKKNTAQVGNGPGEEN
jgi:hypothetical protein